MLFFPSGYKLPHPLEHKIIVKVETTSDSKPEKAMGLALARLRDEFQKLDEGFRLQMANKSNDKGMQAQEDYF